MEKRTQAKITLHLSRNKLNSGEIKSKNIIPSVKRNSINSNNIKDVLKFKKSSKKVFKEKEKEIYTNGSMENEEYEECNFDSDRITLNKNSNEDLFLPLINKNANLNADKKVFCVEFNFRNGSQKTLYMLPINYGGNEELNSGPSLNLPEINNSEIGPVLESGIKSILNASTNNTTSQMEYKIVEINLQNPENKIHQIYFKSYKSAPLCITQTFQAANCIQTKSVKSAHLIWKLYKFEKMMKLIPQITKNQKYNHFPKTFQLGRKDHLWKNFKKMQNKFSKEYDFMPSTFIFPNDIKKFQLNKKILSTTWIVKPVASSRGRGIHLLTDPTEVSTLIKKSQSKVGEYLISKYIENPHIINQKKYDLRIYVLITSFMPLRIYFYNEGLVRFASENYTQSSKDNIFVHLTNYAINKKNKNYEMNNADDEEDFSKASKWSISAYKKYFIENGLEKEIGNIFSKIKDIIIKTILSATDENLQVLRGIIKHKNSLFELYGFDIIIDDKFNPWLLEVNVSPSLNCDSQLDVKIKSDLIRDTINIVGIPINNANVGEGYLGNLNNSNNNIISSGGTGNNKENSNNNNYLTSLNADKKLNISKFKIKVCKDFAINKSNMEFTSEEKIILNESQEYQEILNNFMSETFRSKLGKFELIFPNTNNHDSIRYYSQFVNHPGDDNILLWKWILSNK